MRNLCVLRGFGVVSIRVWCRNVQSPELWVGFLRHPHSRVRLFFHVFFSHTFAVDIFSDVAVSVAFLFFFATLFGRHFFNLLLVYL